MRPWRWQIPQIFQGYIAAQTLRDGGQLFDALDRIEQTVDGVPGFGTILERDEDIFEWHVVGHRILYERLHQQKYLYMVDIQPL